MWTLYSLIWQMLKSMLVFRGIISWVMRELHISTFRDREYNFTYNIWKELIKLINLLLMLFYSTQKMIGKIHGEWNMSRQKHTRTISK